MLNEQTAIKTSKILFLVGILLGLILGFCWNKAFAFDGTITNSELLYRSGYNTNQTELNVGHAINDYRPYIDITYLWANQQGVINDTQVIYAAGTTYKINKSFSIDSGVGYYQPLAGTTNYNSCVYGKVTYSFGNQ